MSVLLIALPVILVGGGTWYFINRIKRVKSKLADYILENPSSAAIVAYTFDENGEFVDDGHSIFHNADKPFVMASTMKLVVLAAFAEAAAIGELDLEEQVQVAVVEKYYLPLTDGGSHAMGLKRLSIAADKDGFAVDHSTRITLRDVAQIMMHFSGNAETDYLISRLGAERIASVMQKAGLDHHMPIRPTLGVVLAMFNHEDGSLSEEQLQQLSAALSRGDSSYLDRLVELYLNNEQWQMAQRQHMLSNQIQANMGWHYQTAASQLFPRGTAGEYARMMARIGSGIFLSPQASAIMQQMIENVASDRPLRILYYRRFGAKDGVAPGILTIASYAAAKRGALKNQSRVVVLITSGLPADVWLEQLQFQGHYLLPVDLVCATGVYNRLAAPLSNEH